MAYFFQAEILALMGTFEESNRIINDIKGFNSIPDCLYIKALCLYLKVKLVLLKVQKLVFVILLEKVIVYVFKIILRTPGRVFKIIFDYFHNIHKAINILLLFLIFCSGVSSKLCSHLLY